MLLLQVRNTKPLAAAAAHDIEAELAVAATSSERHVVQGAILIRDAAVVDGDPAGNAGSCGFASQRHTAVHKSCHEWSLSHG